MIAFLTDVVLVVTGFQLLLLAAVLLSRLPGHSLCRNLLTTFLLTKAFLILRWSTLRFDLLDVALVPGLYLASAAVFFMLAPLLYLYVRALCFRDFRLRRLSLLHLAPLLVFCLLGAWMGSDSSIASGVQKAIADHFWAIFWTSNFVQILVYITAMFRVVLTYRRSLAEQHSTVERIDLRWLIGLLGLISVHWLFVVSRSTTALLNLRDGKFIAVMDLLSITIFLVFTTALVIKGLSHAKVFPGIEERPRGGGAGLPEPQLGGFTEQLLNCMRRDKPHLDPGLTVDELARRLSVPPWQLSRVINSAFRQNFFHFVNHYRVEEAKQRLRDPGDQHKTMLQILHEAGFNSKSTFNQAFKHHTGMTPTEYRRRSLAEPATDETLEHGVA